jgi:DNA-binding Xre family transcriptional regulator
MPVMWNLKKWLAVERDIYRPVDLQKLLAEQAGVQLSIQALSALINKKPGALRFQTVQVLCNALKCELGDFCRVFPDSEVEQEARRKGTGNSPTRLYRSKKRTEKE